MHGKIKKIENRTRLYVEQYSKFLDNFKFEKKNQKKSMVPRLLAKNWVLVDNLGKTWREELSLKYLGSSLVVFVLKKLLQNQSSCQLGYCTFLVNSL